MTTFAELLRHHRARLGLSQTKMADLLGISERAYCGWERDDDPKRKPHRLMQEAALARLEPKSPRPSRETLPNP